MNNLWLYTTLINNWNENEKEWKEKSFKKKISKTGTVKGTWERLRRFYFARYRMPRVNYWRECSCHCSKLPGAHHSCSMQNPIASTITFPLNCCNDHRLSRLINRWKVWKTKTWHSCSPRTTTLHTKLPHNSARSCIIYSRKHTFEQWETESGGVVCACVFFWFLLEKLLSAPIRLQFDFVRSVKCRLSARAVCVIVVRPQSRLIAHLDWIKKNRQP